MAVEEIKVRGAEEAGKKLRTTELKAVRGDRESCPPWNATAEPG